MKKNAERILECQAEELRPYIEGKETIVRSSVDVVKQGAYVTFFFFFLYIYFYE